MDRLGGDFNFNLLLAGSRVADGDDILVFSGVASSGSCVSASAIAGLLKQRLILTEDTEVNVFYLWQQKRPSMSVSATASIQKLGGNEFSNTLATNARLLSRYLAKAMSNLKTTKI
jgi:hypothetical protein